VGHDYFYGNISEYDLLVVEIDQKTSGSAIVKVETNAFGCYL
jgi:hypothetical protein